MRSTHRFVSSVARVAATLLLLASSLPLAAEIVPDGAGEPEAPAQAPTPDPVALELFEVVDQLFESVERGDSAVTAELTCLDDLLAARLLREEALQLIVDAEDPMLVAERRRAVVASSSAYLRDLLARGVALEAVETTRVETFDEPGAQDGGSQETLQTDRGDEPRSITGAGLVAVEMSALDAPVDFEVHRLADRWCVDPLSMTAP